MAKKTRREKAMDSWENYFQKRVFGQTSNSDYHLKALGRKIYSNGEMGFASAEERMDALCRLVLAIAEDVSGIYRVLNVYQKISDNLDSQLELIHTLAIAGYNRDEAEKAERKRLKEAKKKGA